MTDAKLDDAINGFEVRDNCLCVAGRKITDIVREAGGTPLYVYDRSLIEARVKHLRSTLPKGVKIHYAMKANPHRDVVQLLSSLVDGIDVASAGELVIALATNTPHSEISFAGPGKRAAEIDAAVAAGIVLNIESETEVARVMDAARRLKRRAKLAVRVNPSFELKGSGMRMSGGPKPFGVDSERVPEMLRGLPTKELEFTGFHIFTGSQNLNAAAICEAQSKSLDLALELMKHASSSPRFINIGGGFGIPYFPGEKALEISSIGVHLTGLVSRLHEQLPDCDLVIELGRYIVGEAGIYVCEVVDRKISRGHTFLVTNGGLHHHLAASGNFGQVIRKNYPVIIGNRVRGESLESVTVVGPLCTPLDILGDKISVPVSDVGDLVIVLQSGAYGLTASPRGFLGHPDAIEVLL